jgi:transcriptional regulator GlxA family with amidase domain
MRQMQAVGLVRQILLLMAVENETAEANAPLRIGELAASIRREPGRRWRVEEMAAEACLSRSQLTRVFERQLGVAPMAFVIECRLDRARQMLLESRLAVSEIAATLGYEDAHFFSRQFKARFGASPRAFRERGM